VTRSTFAVPALLAAATGLGLVAALTGDGWRDALGWIGLVAPLGAIAWGWRHRT
jgi:hypothetical protein